MPVARLEHSDKRICNVHNMSQCRGRACSIHNRSDHALRSFPQVFRSEGFMERQCPHGVGHPDPDDPFAPQVHGCDGCCGVQVTEDSFFEEAEKFLMP